MVVSRISNETARKRLRNVPPQGPLGREPQVDSNLVVFVAHAACLANDTAVQRRAHEGA